jgi:xylono-1,5-lactonase
LPYNVSVCALALSVDPAYLWVINAEAVHLLELSSARDLRAVAQSHNSPGVVCNDAKIDPYGRLWLGSADAKELEPRGALHCRVDASTTLIADAGFVVVNGPAFSPDATQLYVSDSWGRRILRYELATAPLKVLSREVLVAFRPDEGLPDGLAVDSEGGVWCAHWGGARVTRFSPAGTREEVISLPVPIATSVALGGPDLKTLYITTAHYGLDAATRAAAPRAGDLFAIEVATAGVAAVPFNPPVALAAHPNGQ